MQGLRLRAEQRHLRGRGVLQEEQRARASQVARAREPPGQRVHPAVGRVEFRGASLGAGDLGQPALPRGAVGEDLLSARVWLQNAKATECFTGTVSFKNILFIRSID